MAFQTYGYEAHFQWKWHRTCDAWAIPSKEEVCTELVNDFRTTFLALFAEKLAQSGHWYKIDDVRTDINKYSGTWGIPLPLPPFNIDAEGQTTIYFETDIPDANAPASPQTLVQLVESAIKGVVTWLAAHPQVIVAIVAIGILTILAIWLINTVTGALSEVGKAPGSLALALGILAVVGVAVVGLFFTGRGRKVQERAKPIFRRAYRVFRPRPPALPAPKKARRKR